MTKHAGYITFRSKFKNYSMVILHIFVRPKENMELFDLIFKHSFSLISLLLQRKNITF